MMPVLFAVRIVHAGGLFLFLESVKNGTRHCRLAQIPPRSALPPFDKGGIEGGFVPAETFGTFILAEVSVWHPSQRSDLAEFLLHFPPRITAIETGVDIAVETVGHDDVRVRGVCGKPVDRRIRLYGQGHRLPGLPTIFGTLDRSRLPWDKVPVADKDDIRIIWLQGHPAAVGDAVFLVEARESVQRPALAFVRAGPDAIRGGGEDFPGLAQADRHAVHILVEHVAPQRGKMHPGVSTIPTAEDTVDLHPRPDRTGILRVKDNVRDFRRAGKTLLSDTNGQLFPPLTPVQGTKNTGRFGASKKNVRVGGVDSDRPDLLAIHGRFQQVPGRPFILTAINTGFGAGKNNMRMLRGDGQRSDLDFTRLSAEGEIHFASPPFFSTVRAVPDAGANSSQTYSEVFRHGPYLLFVVSPHSVVVGFRFRLTARLLCLDLGDDRLIALLIERDGNGVARFQLGESTRLALAGDSGIGGHLMSMLVLAGHIRHCQRAVPSRDDLALVRIGSQGWRAHR